VDVLTHARDYRYAAKHRQCSYWVSDKNIDQELDARAHTRSISQVQTNLNRAPSDMRVTEMSSTRILVVEPDGAMACLLQETLALEGYSVEVTNSAIDAFESAKSEPRPHLILLESNMNGPKMDGWELCRELKSDKELAKIWVVMATSHPDQALALEAGADLYLPKPFDMPALLNEVSLLLRSR